MERTYPPIRNHLRLFAPIHESNHFEELLKKVNTLFGGCTTYNGVGYWNSAKETLIREPVNILDIWFTDKRDITNIFPHIRIWAINTKQETIGIEINNSFYIVPTAWESQELILTAMA